VASDTLLREAKHNQIENEWKETTNEGFIPEIQNKLRKCQLARKMADASDAMLQTLQWSKYGQIKPIQN
jgi:hypothetical protein